MAQKTSELPFSARYALPVQVSQDLGEVSWETVAQLSGDFQVKVENRESKVKKIIKELQMSRLLLMERIRQGSRSGRIEPKLLVDIVRLLQRCEEVAAQYDVDLHEFSTFLFLISEKLKKEKIAKYQGDHDLLRLTPIKDELFRLKGRGEGAANGKKKKVK